ncbi:hypothetical protein AGMMS49974_00510 [Deltaproteobacteria bacterium]|nr:hypothetical protein AGMMS49974_00510 [Deltaproteobacteria bacterium]
MADKGYDADYIVEAAAMLDAEAVIPPRSTPKTPRHYDKFLYKQRNIIERMFVEVKQCKVIAGKYNELACHLRPFFSLPPFCSG